MNIEVDLHMNCSYTNELIREVLEEYHSVFILNHSMADDHHRLYWLEYEDIDFDMLYRVAKQSNEKKILANSFCIRKGLLRKANFALFIRQYLAKKPHSILRDHYPETHILELSHPDYLDEALNEAFELRDVLEENTHSTNTPVSFILKASILDKASELFMFSKQSELEGFFARESDDNDEDDDDNISNVREWIIQRYLSNPKLLPNYGNRKFHLRVYVVAQANLRVYVYDGILALFASLPYQYDGENYDRLRHITNTCAQTNSNVDESELVKEFWTLEGLDKEKIFEQIKMITQEIFTGLHHETTIFQPLKNAFEIYGFDFLINEDDQVYFLEANAYPDFKQTGSTLSILIKELFENVVQEIIHPYFHIQSTTSKSVQRQLHLVYDKQKHF